MAEMQCEDGRSSVQKDDRDSPMTDSFHQFRVLTFLSFNHRQSCRENSLTKQHLGVSEMKEVSLTSGQSSQVD